MYATEVFGQYASQFRQTALDQDVLHYTKRAVIDWFASLFPGLAVAPVPMIKQLLSEDLGRGRARLPDGQYALARAAALFNGAASHAAEVDDSFRDAMYHPGSATVAAALAIAQDRNASGLEFLHGVVLGYEVSTRIGVVMGRSHYRYWHNAGTVGTLGAAAAAAGILDLHGLPFAHALATAATFAAGLQQAFRMDSMSKPLHTGRAAEGGVLAAQLAAKGVVGSLDVLDGDAGFGQAMSNGPDWGRVGATLGVDFHITRLTHKNHVGCGHAFAAIDGALALMHRHELRAEAIRHVRIGTYGPALDIACYEDPKTEHECRFSLRFMVATALVHGSVRLAAYLPERLEDTDIRALLKRITAVVDPDIDAAFPGRRAARVEIDTADGQTYSWLQSDRKGDPELPLSDAELEEKFRELASPVIGEEKARVLLERIWMLDQAKDLSGVSQW